MMEALYRYIPNFISLLITPALSWISGNAYYANNYGRIPNQSTV